MRTLTVAVERFQIAGTFTIARGSKTEAVVVSATITDGANTGRGECVPYARYNETVEGVTADITRQADAIAAGMTRIELQNQMPAGAARNAIDCALWDLEAKASGRPVHEIAGIAAPQPCVTAYTISLGTPDAMAAAAATAAHRPLLKIKLGGAGDVERIAAVRTAAPNSRLIVDANEAWTPDLFDANVAACAAAGVEVIEQPLPAGRDEVLARLTRRVPICADESVHDSRTVAELVGRYDAINIKLDKTGGLTQALLLAARAKTLGLGIMVGCMVGSSLAMAPAMLLTPGAKWVDLDGPLLLKADRDGGLRYDGSIVHPALCALWG
ncbi:MAG: N-acetyl-D-Glu racemase DgcA [Hyphomicrobiaceae bacterium]